jgi:branched-chain amino acid transport system permease protein
VVLGGLGNVLGSVISATALYILPEIMKNAALQNSGGWQQAFAQFLEDYRMLLYAGILIILMICTWSPKIKGFISRQTDSVKQFVKGLFSKKKEVTDHEG